MTKFKPACLRHAPTASPAGPAPMMATSVCSGICSVRYFGMIKAICASPSARLMALMPVPMMHVRYVPMNVPVMVALREVKPHPEPHQQACDNQLQSDRFAKPQYGRNCSEQGCGCKICRSTRRPEIAESNNEQR